MKLHEAGPGFVEQDVVAEVADGLEDHLGTVTRAVIGALFDDGDAERARLAPGFRIPDQRMILDALAQGGFVEGVPAHRADQPPGVAYRRYVQRNAAGDHQRAVMGSLVIVAVEQHEVAIGDECAQRHLVGSRGAVEHKVGFFRPEDLRRLLLRLQRRPFVGQEVAEVEHGIVEVVAKHRFAEMFDEHPADRAAAVKHAAIVARAGPQLVALLGIVDECAEKRRLQGLGILLQTADQVFGDKGRCLLRQEDIAVDEVEHLDRQVLEPLAADQQDDREIEAATPHQIDERRGLAFQTLLAPVDHHAADGGVGLHGDFRILELARPDHFEAGALDFGDDLVETEPFEIVGIKDGSREQKREAPEVVHGCPRMRIEPSCWGIR
jgi:hypothetical protein